LGGVINTRFWNFTGTARVTKDLVVFASDEVNIRGKLEVPRGIQVAFFTPSFNLGDKYGRNGEIVAVDNPDYKGPVSDIICSRTTIFYVSSPGWTIGPGDGLEIASDSESSFLSLRSLTMQPGATGGAKGQSPNGQIGGSIDIGTPKAIADAERLAKKHGRAIKAFPMGNVSVSYPIHAGDGGNGKDDPTGHLVGGVYNFAAYDGGNGGSIDIVAKEVEPLLGDSAATFTAGNGGNGGAIAAAVTGVTNNPMNGTATSPNAIPAAIFMGAGGSGGSISVRAKVSDKVAFGAGSGGNASLVNDNPADAGSYAFWAGNGFASPAPGALTFGNGGDVDVHLALPGNFGSGSNAKAVKPSNGQYYPLTFFGGQACNACGGAATYPGVAASQLLQGANGGSLTLILPTGATPAELVSIYGLKISLAGYGSGGGSVLTDTPYSYCPSPDPPGINGGNGGALHDNGLWPLMYPSASSNWGWGFYAGGGSAGNPGGNVGLNGYDDEGQEIGQVNPDQNVICNGHT
jgi:hypothetical protein